MGCFEHYYTFSEVINGLLAESGSLVEALMIFCVQGSELIIPMVTRELGGSYRLPQDDHHDKKDKIGNDV